MAQGPNESRFKNSLHGASYESVDDAALEWAKCAELLESVSESVKTAADKDKKIGGQTGPAMGAAFRRTSESIKERAALLREGKSALESAARVLDKAEKARDAMDKNHPPMNNPGSWTRPVGPLTEEDLEAQRKHQQKVNDFQDSYAAREKISQQWSQNIDNVFEDSTEVMKKIHGEPDPPPPTKPGTGKPGSIDPTKGTPQEPIDTDTGHDNDNDDTGNDDTGNDDTGNDDTGNDDTGNDDTGNDDTGNDDTGNDDTGGDTGGDTDNPEHGGGISTGTLGGLAAGVGGGALALGGLRNGGLQLPSALSSNGVRPIGTTGRLGTSGALGRTSGALAPGSPVSRTGAAGRGAAGRGTGGVGTGGAGTRGGRSGSGARGAGRGARGGAGGIGTGRGAGKKDEEKKQGPRDLFDDGEDWIDDEGAAPDVLT